MHRNVEDPNSYSKVSMRVDIPSKRHAANTLIELQHILQALKAAGDLAARASVFIRFMMKLNTAGNFHRFCSKLEEFSRANRSAPALSPTGHSVRVVKQVSHRD